MYKCKKCNQQFNSIPGLSNHVRWHHKEIIIYQCQLCNRKFIGSAAFIIHKRVCESRTVKNKYPQFCDLCGHKISQAVYARHHKYCNGLGPRRLRQKKNLYAPHGKTYIQIFGAQKAKQIINKISKTAKSHYIAGVSGHAKTEQKQAIRCKKISDYILNRYQTG